VLFDNPVVTDVNLTVETNSLFNFDGIIWKEKSRLLAGFFLWSSRLDQTHRIPAV
jgi:hypothetical protein